MLKLNSKQLKALDQKAQDYYGIPGLILMENAGLRAYDVAYKILEKQKLKNVAVFCGRGNNGGDGFVVARHLLNNNINVTIFILGEPKNIKGDALINYKILKKMKAQMITLKSVLNLRKAVVGLEKSGLIIDAIFGIGLNKVINGLFEDVISQINKANVPVVSLDVPSGLCIDTGEIFGCCIKAHTTVTFGALKKGFYKQDGPKNAGKVMLADISLPKELFKIRNLNT